MIIIINLSTSTLNGKLLIPNLKNKTLIQRESNGLIHIISLNNHDLFFTQGYINAENRLYQIELFKRIANGKLSEITSINSLKLDKLMRTLNFKNIVKNDINSMNDNTKMILQSYCDGINSFIKFNKILSIEFYLLNLTPKEFKIEDILIINKLFSWISDGNRIYELERYKLLQTGLTIERINELLPNNYKNTLINDDELNNKFKNSINKLNHKAFKPNIINNPRENSTVSKNEFSYFFPESINDEFDNSYGFVIGKSFSKLSILSSDIKLPLTIPSLFNIIHLKSPTINSIGSTIPGIPGIISGYNEYISWSFSNLLSDTQDYFIINEFNNTHYNYNNKLLKYKISNEIIKINGKENLNLKVLNTEYGPVMNQVQEINGNHKLSLSWTGLNSNDKSIESQLKILTSKNWNDFKLSLSEYSNPSRNYIYSDTNGNIGYLMASNIPIRKGNYSGLFPVLGDGINNKWIGKLNYNKLPKILNPTKDYLIINNIKSTPNSYLPIITNDYYTTSYSFIRLNELILKLKKSSNINDIKLIQSDTKSILFLNDIKNVLSFIGNNTNDNEINELINNLMKWDGIYKNDEYSTIIEEFYHHLKEFPTRETKSINFNSPKFIFKALNGSGIEESMCDKLWDDLSCRRVSILLLKRAIESLKSKFGNIPNYETISEITLLHFIQYKFNFLQCMSHRFLKINNGGTSLINHFKIGFYNDNKLIKVGTVYRQIVDMNNLLNSKFILLGGTSGNIFSEFYNNLNDKLSTNDYIDMKIKEYNVKYTLELNGL